MQFSAARASLRETDTAYDSVAQAERLAQQAGAELTTLIHELRPPSLEHRDLSTALKGHIEEWSRQHKIEVVSNIEDGLSVNIPAEQALFRVAQEALSNVARHSHASRVSVTLADRGDEILLTIEDNGVGFDPNISIKGVGLDSMGERLDSIGGKLEISSQRGKGACVMASMRRS